MKGSKRILTLLLSILLLLPSVTLTVDARGASGSWRHNSRGWWFAYSSGGYPAAKWELINDQWYYFNGSGYMATGWKKLGNYWYYLKSSGAMATGWYLVNGVWYYSNSSGQMLTGWQKINGKWYYMNSSGAMQTGWLKSGGNWYLLASAGHMLTGWQKSGGYWYFLDSSGKMLTGWIYDKGNWYYTNSSGAMVVGAYTINGTVYQFDSSGRMVSEVTQWSPVYYSQRDERWASLQFGAWNIYTAGCVPTSLAMIFSGLSGKSILPSEVAEWLYNNTTEFNQRSIGGGGLCAVYASEHWGYNCKGLGSVSEIQNELAAGRMVIAYQGAGLFAKSGNSHAIVLFKYSSGSTYVYDSWDSGRNGWYSVSTLWSQKSTDPDDNLGGYVYYSIYK